MPVFKKTLFLSNQRKWEIFPLLITEISFYVLVLCTKKKKKSFILRSQYWVPSLFFFSCYSFPVFPASSIKYTLKIRTKIQLEPCYKLLPWDWNDKDRATSEDLFFIFFLSEEQQWSLWPGGIAQFASVLPFPSVLLQEGCNLTYGFPQHTAFSEACLYQFPCWFLQK